MISREMTPHSSVRKRAEPDRTRTVSLTLSSPKFVIQSQTVLSKQAEKIANKANIHEQFINKVTYCLGVLSFGTFCYLLGSRPQDIPRLYCLFFISVAPLRWIYYRIKKWHYYLLDFCYYANAIFVTMLLFFPDNEKLFMACFSFSEGPLAWALIVWRCSLVFSSIDKIISVLIHLLPGIVFFIIRWWDPNTFPCHSAKETGLWPAWPVVTSVPALWTWLFFVPLLAYCIWQALYFLVVEGLRRQRILEDPEVMTSYRELKRKAERAKNLWWRLSGLLGAENRVIMYAIIQAAFTVAALAFTVPLFKSYRLHVGFEIFKISATVWNGGSFVFEVMPRQAAKSKKNKSGPIEVVDEIHRQESSDDSKKKSVLVTPAASTGSSDVASLADISVRLKQKEQDVCALCRRPRCPNLAASTNRPDNVTSTRKYEDGAASFTMRSSTNGENRMFCERRQVQCNTKIDALIRNLNWIGQVACVG